MDIPFCQRSVDTTKKELAESVQREQEAKATLDRYKEAGLRERILHLIDDDRHILEVLHDLGRFRTVVSRIYQEHEQKIEICASILMKLPDREPRIIP
jgi:hypothetical protein